MSPEISCTCHVRRQTVRYGRHRPAGREREGFALVVLRDGGIASLPDQPIEADGVHVVGFDQQGITRTLPNDDIGAEQAA